MTHTKPQYAISLTLEALIPDGYLFVQKIAIPLSLPFVEAAEADEKGDGHIVISGYGLAVWQYAFIDQASRDLLRNYCASGTGYSQELYIRTLDQNYEWQNYRAIMTWPARGETFTVDNSIALQIQFKILELITP